MPTQNEVEDNPFNPMQKTSKDTQNNKEENQGKEAHLTQAETEEWCEKHDVKISFETTKDHYVAIVKATIKNITFSTRAATIKEAIQLSIAKERLFEKADKAIRTAVIAASILINSQTLIQQIIRQIYSDLIRGEPKI